jgi:O-antigen/teichoic acid export membrane protein
MTTKSVNAQSGRSGGGFGVAGASFAVNVVVVTVGAVLVSRRYGVTTIGEQALASIPYLVTMRFSSMSEQTALARLISVAPRRDRDAGGLVLVVFAFSFLLTVVAAAIVFFLLTVVLGGTLTENDLVAPALVLLIGYVLMENTSWGMDTVIAATGGHRALFVVRLITAVSFIVAALAYARVLPDVWGLVWATVTSFGVGLVARAALIPRYCALRPGVAALRSGVRRLPVVLRFGIATLPGSVTSGIASQVAVWVIGATQPVAAVGAYSRASSIAVKLGDAGFRITEVLLPRLVRAHRDGPLGVGVANELVLRTTRRTAVGLGLVVGVVGGAADGVLGLFGEGFAAADTVLICLLVGNAAWVLSMIWSQPFYAANRPSLASRIAVARSSAIILGVAVAGNLGSITAIAVVWATVHVVEVVVKMQIARTTVLAGTRRPAMWSPIVRLGTSTALAAAVARLADVSLRPTGGLEEIIGLAGALTVGAIAYTCAVVATGALSRSDVRRLLDLRHSRRATGPIAADGELAA